MRDMLPELLAKVVARLDPGLEDDEAEDGLAGDLILAADHRGFRHAFVVNQGTLDLGRAQAMPGDVHDIVDATHQPVVAILVAAAHRPRESTCPGS